MDFEIDPRINLIVERFCEYFKDKDAVVVSNALSMIHHGSHPLDLNKILDLDDREEFTKAVLVMVNSIDPVTGVYTDPYYVPSFSLSHIRACEEFKRLKKEEADREKRKEQKDK